LQRHRTLLQVKKVSFEHIFIAVFGLSISSTNFISKTNISLSFFFTDQFLSVFERYPQDLASVTLAVAKRHVVFGPAPPWSSRLIAAEVVWRLPFHHSHQYWWSMDDLQHFQMLLSETMFPSNQISFWACQKLEYRFPIDY